jgi:acyl carrier protein
MEISRAELLKVFKDIVCETAAKAHPSQAVELDTLRAHLESGLDLESPLSSLGWDSMQMTWLLVRLEEHFDIDTSHLSIFDLFTIGDLLDELQNLIADREEHYG